MSFILKPLCCISLIGTVSEPCCYHLKRERRLSMTCWMRLRGIFLFSPSFQLLESVVPGEETAINRTCLAALLSEKGTVEGITEQEKKKLKKALKDAMLHYRHQLNKTQRRNANSPRRALIRMILFYLHSTRDQATNLQIAVSNKVLDKVKEFIQQFNREFLVNCSMRDKALFCNAYGDLLTRKGQYEEGW